MLHKTAPQKVKYWCSSNNMHDRLAAKNDVTQTNVTSVLM